MADKFRSLEASLSADQHAQVIKLLSSKRTVAELMEELPRIVDPGTGEPVALKIKTCGLCNCQTGYQTCTQWVYRNGKWMPLVVTLEACSGLSRFFGCLLGLFGIR